MGRIFSRPFSHLGSFPLDVFDFFSFLWLRRGGVFKGLCLGTLYLICCSRQIYSCLTLTFYFNYNNPILQLGTFIRGLDNYLKRYCTPSDQAMKLLDISFGVCFALLTSEGPWLIYVTKVIVVPRVRVRS